MAAPTQKRKVLSLKEKLDVLNAIKEDVKPFDILQQFGIGMSTFYKIKANEEALRNAALKYKTNLKGKRAKTSSYEKLNRALSMWFHQMRANDAQVIISGPVIMKKAKQLAIEMNIEFQPSNGWLQRWKEKENITFKTVHDDKKAADFWLQSVLPDILNGYDKCNIYSADESGLFYKALPKWTIQMDNPNEEQKEQITTLFICNQDGSDKQIFVIGKPTFKNMTNLPLPYYRNKKAWMVSEIWSQILKDFDKNMQNQQRKILLFVGNAPCHTLTDNVELSNIKIIFLPANTNSWIQPMDRGIIQNVKVHYRQQLLRKQLVSIETGENVAEFYKKINVPAAIHMLNYALSKLKPETIQNCFRQAGFEKLNDEEMMIITPEFEDNSVLTSEEIQEWMDIDKQALCYGGNCNDANSETEDSDDDRPIAVRPQRSEVFAALETLHRYYDFQMSDHTKLYELENQVLEDMQK